MKYNDEVIAHTKHLYSVVIDGLKGLCEFAEIMGHPGVTFTPEQRAKIDNFMKIKDSESARIMILHKLDDEFKEDTPCQ